MAVTPAESVDLRWKGLYRAGGISTVIVGLIFFLFVALLVSLGPSLSSTQAALKNLAGQALTVHLAFGLGIVGDLFTIPAVVALYAALKGIHRNAMLVAAGFLFVYLILDFGVTNLNIISLVTLSQNYAATTSDVQRAAYVATTDYVLAVLAWSVPTASYLASSVGVLIASLVMLKGIFGRGVAYLGITSSLLGIAFGISVVAPGHLPNGFVAVTTVLSGIWFVLVGVKLYQLGGR